jgi:AraC-like DNA-binding protein
LAKIAVTSDRAEVRGTRARLLAAGTDWSVSEVVCTFGPRDNPFEERHSGVSIAVVIGGTFEYRSHAGSELMTPGSLLLGSAGQAFECGHDHGAGDRCISFSYSPDYLDRFDVAPAFRGMRVPPLRELSPLVARAAAGLGATSGICWEELAIELASAAAELDRGRSPEPAGTTAASAARVARLVRAIERDPGHPFDLDTMAREARLSPYHFLRMFRQVTGVTPHQHLLRRRLQRAAVRLAEEPTKIVEILLECGFGDVSNFNRTFRAEFGAAPRAWRRSLSRP